MERGLNLHLLLVRFTNFQLEALNRLRTLIPGESVIQAVLNSDRIRPQELPFPIICSPMFPGLTRFFWQSAEEGRDEKSTQQIGDESKN